MIYRVRPMAFPPIFPQSPCLFPAMIKEEELPDLITVKETSKYLRIPLPTVYYLVQRGQLPAVQIGGRWRIKRKLLDRDILKNGEKTRTKVMVIDDDSAIRSLFAKFFSKAGVDSLMAENADSALKVLETAKPDMIFLDLNLPDLPGDELYLHIKELYPDVPVTVITGYPDSETLNRILSSGPVTVLKKPLELSQLDGILRTLIGS